MSDFPPILPGIRWREPGSDNKILRESPKFKLVAICGNLG